MYYLALEWIITQTVSQADGQITLSFDLFGKVGPSHLCLNLTQPMSSAPSLALGSMSCSIAAPCHLSSHHFEYEFGAVGIPLFKSLIELFPEAQPLFDGVMGNYHEVCFFNSVMLFMTWCTCICYRHSCISVWVIEPDCVDVQ